jgi:protein arginine kinase
LTDHMEKGKMEGVITSGLQGNPDELVGDILMLRNVYTLGINEESILASIRNAILHIVMAEKNLRSQIKSNKMANFKDHISRSLGLLKFSYQLDAHEALSAISFLKLGIELGWVKGLSVREVNTLFFDSRRSHLTYLLSEKSPSEDITFKRAEYLRKKTAAVTIDF